MTVALPKTRMTVAEFLRWTRDVSGDERFELVDGNVVAMAPERLTHGRAKFAATNALAAAISRSGLDCEAVIDSVGVSTDTHNYRIPDVSVFCGGRDPQSYMLEEPLVLVEVVSPSTEERDVHAKLTEYFQLASLHHYLILYPDRHLAVHHRRVTGINGVQTTFVRNGSIDLTPPGLSVSVDDLLGKATA